LRVGSWVLGRAKEKRKTKQKDGAVKGGHERAYRAEVTIPVGGAKKKGWERVMVCIKGEGGKTAFKTLAEKEKTIVDGPTKTRKKT